MAEKRQIASFNESNFVAKINKDNEIAIDLDIMTSQIEPFTDPKNHWVAAIALFHYTVKYSEIEWDSDHALILTLADLFSDTYPLRTRSETNRSQENLMETARKYIQEMKSYQRAWSKITPAKYQAALELYPKWPKIEDPLIDSDGDEVELANLMQAFAFCFKEPSASAKLKIRSGLWAAVITSATNGTVRSEMLEHTTRELSDILGQKLSISKALIDMIEKEINSFISVDDLFENLTSTFRYDIVSRVKFIIAEATWASLPELRTIVTAMENAVGFEWSSIPHQDFKKYLVKDLKKLKENSPKFLKNPGGFNPNNYWNYASLSKQLLIHLRLAKISDFNDWSMRPKDTDLVTQLVLSHIRNAKKDPDSQIPADIRDAMNDLLSCMS